MVENRVLHYKKTYNKYEIETYRKSLPIDYYCEILEDSYKLKKVPKYGYFEVENIQTVNEEVFIKYYGKKHVSVKSTSLTMVIEEYDDKISLKYYRTNKSRRVGGPYFKYSRHMSYITYNLKTKNVYVGDVTKKNKRVVDRKIRVNCFNLHFLSSFKLTVNRFIREITFDDNNYVESVSLGDYNSNEILQVFLSILERKTGVLIDDEIGSDYQIFRIYLNHNGFKYPNTINQFIGINFSKRDLRKYINVVNLIITQLNLGGKKVKRLLNSVDNIDLSLTATLYHLLGINYFNKVEDFVLISNQPSNTPYDLRKHINYISERVTYKLSNKDKIRIVKALNSRIRFGLIMNHLDMIERLKKEYDYDFKMKFNDKGSFDLEHYNLSKILESYTTGFVTRSYGDFSKENIEKVIYGTDGVEYHPVVLLTSDDYNNESSIQYNCVRTYVEKPQSLVISLRQGSIDSNERATIEYKFRRNEIIRTQSLGKFNKGLPPSYDVPLEILDDTVRKLYHKDILHLPRMVKKYRSGKKIEQKSEFKCVDDESSYNIYPVWDNKTNESDNFFGFDLLF